jgi:ribonuclease HI
MSKEVYQVKLYVDGSALGNPGPGGYAAILQCNGQEKVVCEGTSETTTNNRMELQAVIAGLRALKTQAVALTLYTDSQYVAGQLNGNRTRANQALVAEMREFVSALSHFQVIKVAAHAGDVANERCDRLAREAAEQAAKQAEASVA